VLELTSRQAAVFGLSRRGRVEVGALGDVTVFALEDLHRNRAVMADDLPGNAARLRRPGTVLGHQPARSS